MPVVSIIIPAYNVAPYIGETLDSVVAQTFADYEVIVINDGSPDIEDLECALARFTGRLNYLKQENRGASAARNTGLRAAQGELVAFLDADDLWLPNYLYEQVKFMRARDCDLVCADAEVFNDASREEKTYMESLMADAPPTGDVTFLGLLSAEQSLITSGVVARRELIHQVGLFDEALRNSQDFDLWLRLARLGAQMAYQRRTLPCSKGSNVRTICPRPNVRKSFQLSSAGERCWNLSWANSTWRRVNSPARVNLSERQTSRGEAGKLRQRSAYLVWRRASCSLFISTASELLDQSSRRKRLTCVTQKKSTDSEPLRRQNSGLQKLKR